MRSQGLLLCRVVALKCHSVHRYSVVIFTLSGPLELYDYFFIWEQSSAQPGARWRERCHVISLMNRLNKMESLDAVFPKDLFFSHK